MSRSINIGMLLSCLETLMGSDNERIMFVKEVAATNPNIVIKYYNRIDENRERENELHRLRQELNDAHYKCADFQRESQRLREELKAKETFNTTKIQFDACADAQDKAFCENYNQRVSVTFTLCMPDKKIPSVKWMCEATGYGLAEAKLWTEGGNPFYCTYEKARKLREHFRLFAATIGYTGIININAA